MTGKSKTASKHVKVRVAWIKEREDAGDFNTVYFPANDMKSDGLTKPKSTESHELFRNDLGMTSRDIPKERAVRFGTVSVMGETSTKKAIRLEDQE